METVVQRLRKKPEAKIAVKGNNGVKIVKACTINRNPEELFRFWRHFENLPLFMKHLVSVTQTSDKESHWVAKGPAGKDYEWTAIVINEHDNSMIAWRSKEGSDVDHAGTVRFERAPSGGTEVRVTLEYNPPGGKLGKMLAQIMGDDPAEQIDEDLKRFKALMETGEIPTVAGQPMGGPQGKRRMP